MPGSYAGPAYSASRGRIPATTKFIFAATWTNPTQHGFAGLIINGRSNSYITYTFPLLAPTTFTSFGAVMV